MVDITLRITKTHKEVEAVSAVDHIRAEHKTQEGNKEITIQTAQNNVINAETNTIRHLQSCPAKDKICSKCAKRGHFAKVCRSTNVNYLGTRQDEQQEEIETVSLETDPVAFAEFTSNNGWDEYQIDKFSVMAIVKYITCSEFSAANFRPIRMQQNSNLHTTL